MRPEEVELKLEKFEEEGKRPGNEKLEKFGIQKARKKKTDRQTKTETYRD